MRFPKNLLIALLTGIAGIMQAQVAYVPEVTDATINSRTIDVGKPVGVTLGVHGVSSTGAATYSIPLSVPPGTNGVAPTLALTYNSFAGDGLLGVGWGLSGLSSIQRVGSDVYHDGSTAPVKFSNADYFALDGQRLVNTYGYTYHSQDASYDTENAQFAFVTRVGTYGSGPAGFKAVFKNGMTHWYGSVDGASSSSLALRSSGGEVLSWLLSKTEDPFGNVVRYTYSNNDPSEAKRIVSIQYTINEAQNLPAYNTIDFIYNTRSDKNIAYHSGSTIKSDFLLERIDIKAEGSLMKQYELKYAQRQQQTSYLAELIELVDGGTALNSTLFKYGDLLASQESQTSTTSVGQNELCDLFYGDFDGNGVSDILKAPFYYYFIGNNGPQYKCHTGFSVYLNGSSASTFNYSVPAGILAHLANTVGNAQLIASDVDGDGKDDVIISYDSHIPLPPFQKFILDEIQLWRSTSDGTNASFTQTTIGRPDNTYRWLYPETPREYLIPGDYDGDGKTELAFFGYDYQWNYSQVYLWRYGSGWTQQNMGSAANHFGNGKRINVGDFDGDGKWELVSRNSNYSQQCYVVGMDSPNTWSVLFTAAAPTADQEVFLGDFNGDGKQEFLMKTNNSNWYLSYSTGTAFTTAWSITLSPWPDGSSKVLVGDFNGDGKSDIFHGYYSAGHKMKVAYSKGLLTSGPSWDWKSFSASDGFTTVGLGDFNGDGKMDVISRNYQAGPSRIIYFNVKTHERRLDKISNGMNFLVDFDYRYMTEPAVYAEETWGTYNVPLPLVYSVKTSNGIGGTNADIHKYFDSRGMRNGPGFIGFLKHRMDNAVQDRRVEDSYYENGTYAALVPVKNEVSTLAAGALVRSRTYIVGGIGLGAMRRHYDRTDMVTENDYLAGTKRVLSDFLWDAYYNVKQFKEQVYFTVSSPISTRVTTTPTFVTSGPYPYPSKPASEQVVATRTGQPAVTVNTAYEYFPATGALKKKTEFENKPVKLITDITYWPAGNPKETRTSYTGLNPNDHRLNSWTYDPKFRYPVTATQRWNNAGLVNITESFTYDPKWGSPLTHLSTDQLKTDYTYDAFGNRTSVSAPYLPGSPRYTIAEALTWNVSGNKRYKKTITHPGKPTVSTTYDLLGREVESATASFATGTYSTATTSYNSRGDVYQTTRPKLAAEATQTDTRYYDDPYGRLSSLENSFSGTTTYAYTYAGGQLTTTITDPATHARKTTTDATGKTVQTHDDGGDLNYTYDGWGNLLTVKHGAQTLVTNTYDVYGRQTKLVDADAGTTEYLYNAFGLLTWQKTTGQETTLTYDNLGRLKTRTTPEGTNTWAYYYQGGKFNNNVVSDGSRNYTYNSLGLMETGYSRYYQYDNLDRLQAVQVSSSPMSLQLDYTYTTTGYLDQVKLGSVSLFDGVSMNGSGRYTSYTLADGKTTTVTYDHQYPTRYYAPGVQDLNMDYQYSTGNLLHRWDKQKLRKETFEYDALDRLKQAQVHTTTSSGGILQSNPAISYTYDGSVGGTTKGNLATRTDIGQFGTIGRNRIYRASGANFPYPYNDPPLAITPGPQNITYTSYHQPASISETVNGTPYLLEYTYDADQQRNYSKLRNMNNPGTPVEERWYEHGLETVRHNGQTSNTHKALYVEGGDGLCAIIAVGPTTTLTPYVVYKDHLGSIVTVNRPTGGGNSQIYVEQNFDAWGRHRSPTTWAYAEPVLPPWLFRGYTGHENAWPFTLINMNGRMYDPLNGRMLSADNYVQGSLGTQGYNRYSYAGNNPLKYTDPSGEFVQYIIGGIIGGIQGYMIGQNAGLKGGKLWTSTLAGAGIGALSAGVATSISASSGAVVGSMAGGAISGSGMNLISGVANGQNAGAVAGGMLAGGFLGGINGLISGGIGSGIGGGAGAFTGGASAGTLSAIIGGQDGNGILKSAMVGGASSFGLYHLSGALNYRAYKRSGLVFGESGRQLSYRQFMGMGADFGRSRFWNREHGGMLLEDGSIYRGAVAGRGPDFIKWNSSDIPTNTWGTYHTHWAKAGDPAPGGGVYIDYHSTLDFDGPLSTHFPSFVVTRGDVVYKPAYNGPYDTGILQHFQLGIQRYLIFPFFSIP